jgi:phosphorylcholine metabolism protein LicD
MLYHNSFKAYKPIYPKPLINHRNGKKFRTCNLNVRSCKNRGAWIGWREHGIPKCCYAILSSMVKNISTVLYKNKIHYWIDWGCLLGMIRSGDLIKHDRDIDFGIFKKDRNKLFSSSVKNDFSKIGYVIKKIKWHNGAEIQPKKNKNFAEVFIYGPHETDGDFGENSIGVNLIGYKTNDKQRHASFRSPRSYFENLDTINYQGCNINIPKNSKEYLQLRYGSNWETPLAAGKWGDERFAKHNHPHLRQVVATRLHQQKKINYESF